MEVVCARGRAPRFPASEFQGLCSKLKNPTPRCLDSIDTLHAEAAEHQEATVLGYIGEGDARKWLGWNYGGLFALGHRGALVFCLPEGVIVF